MIEILIIAMIGGLLYRMRGAHHEPLLGMSGRMQKILYMLAFSSLYATAAFCVSGTWAGIIVWIVTFGSITAGHASYIDLAHVKDGAANAPSDGETEEWYGTWIPGSGYWHEFAGLAVSGLLITLPAGIATLNPVIGLSGALKAPAYAIGWLIEDWTEFNMFVFREALTGMLLWGSLAWVVL